VPLLFVAVAAADVQSEITGGRSPGELVLEEIGYGIVGGVVARLLAAVIVTQAGERDLIGAAWRQVIPAAGPRSPPGSPAGSTGRASSLPVVDGTVFGGAAAFARRGRSQPPYLSPGSRSNAGGL
jgi:hypothetical protein